MRGYWKNVAFEAAFLDGVLVLCWLALWKKPRAWIRSLLAGSVVPLLFAPYYLGYCALAFTSAGPQGGALYPILLVGGFRGLRGDWNAFDVWLLEILPKPLADLTQSPGAMWSLTGGGVPPTTVLIAGALIGATSYFLIRWFARRARDASNA